MLNLKKYSDGRFFDTTAKKYIKKEKLVELINKGEKIQVTLTKTGKDITDTVIGQFSKSKKAEQKKEKKKNEIPFMKTDKLIKWLGEVIDSKIEKVMEVVKLPTREQVANLDENIKELNKKIDTLKLSQEKAAKTKAIRKKAAASKKPAAAPETTASKETTLMDEKPVQEKPVTENKTVTERETETV